MAGARSGSTRNFVVEDDVLHNWRLLLLVQDKTMNQAADLDELSLFRDMARRAFEQKSRHTTSNGKPTRWSPGHCGIDSERPAY